MRASSRLQHLGAVTARATRAAPAAAHRGLRGRQEQSVPADELGGEDEDASNIWGHRKSGKKKYPTEDFSLKRDCFCST